jgi:hypothetical protein
MPLRDHFHPPLEDQHYWEGFHSGWANEIVRQLNGGVRPPRYRADPLVTLGLQVEADVATSEREATGAAGGSGNGVATAVWSPPRAAPTCPVTFPAEDVFEVRIYDRKRGLRLVAAVELVSPRNKDRPGSRRTFAIKCASYLQQRVGLVVVDIVTDRQRDLYAELIDLLGLPLTSNWPGDPPLYALALRTTKTDSGWQFDSWTEPLSLGQPLPTMPLWLASDLAVPVDLEASYEETFRVLRLD